MVRREVKLTFQQNRQQTSPPPLSVRGSSRGLGLKDQHRRTADAGGDRRIDGDRRRRDMKPQR